jgi:hypothetical protein
LLHLTGDAAGNAIYLIEGRSIGDVATILLLATLYAGVFFFLHYATRREIKTIRANSFTPIIVSLAFAAAILMNIDLVIPYPQPAHYATYVKIALVAASLCIGRAVVGKRWPRAKASVAIVIGTGTLLLIGAYAAYLITVQPPLDEATATADRELIAFFEKQDTESVVMTISPRVNILLSTHAGVYRFNPDKFYSAASIEETAQRWRQTITVTGFNEEEFLKAIDNRYFFKSAYYHLLEPENIIAAYKNASVGSYRYDYVVLGPYEQLRLVDNRLAESHVEVYRNERFVVYRREQSDS